MLFLATLPTQQLYLTSESELNHCVAVLRSPAFGGGGGGGGGIPFSLRSMGLPDLYDTLKTPEVS